MKKRKLDPAREKQIKKLFSLMNKQNLRFILVAPPLVDMMDMVIANDELEFLLKMGTKSYNFDTAQSLSKISGKNFVAFFDQLQRKGLVHIGHDSDGNEEYRLAAIAVGWYETMMHYSIGKPYEKEFSEKWNDYFKLFQKFNFFPVRHIQNVIMRKILTPSQDAALMKPKLRGRKGKINIPVNNKISQDPKIYPSYLVNDLVEEFGKRIPSIYFPVFVDMEVKSLVRSAILPFPKNLVWLSGLWHRLGRAGDTDAISPKKKPSIFFQKFRKKVPYIQ